MLQRKRDVVGINKNSRSANTDISSHTRIDKWFRYNGYGAYVNMESFSKTRNSCTTTHFQNAPFIFRLEMFSDLHKK